MTTSPPAARGEKLLYEFDAFRVDPVRRRLLRDGEPVALTPKSFSILLVLLENRGQVVEKEELIRRVWGDAYVTEANLTQNVSSLRKALGERANDHRFVVTVPGMGYSFVAEVRDVQRDPTVEMPSLDESGVFRLPPPGLEESGVFHMPPPTTTESAIPVSPLPPPVEPPRVKGRRRFLIVGLLLGFLLAVGLAWISNRQRPTPPAPAPASPEAEREPGSARPAGFRSTVAVLKFRNLANNRQQDWLAAALAEMLTTELSTGSKVRMISGDEIARVKQSLALPYTEELSEASLKQIHEGLGADLVVIGSFLSLGDAANAKVRIDLRVVRAPEGDTVASLAEVGTEEDLFELVSVVGGKLRQELRWGQPSPAEAKAAQALQPGNTEANRLYNEGLARLRAFDSAGARDFLLQAVQADPRSAVIRSNLALAWSNLGHEAEARQEAEEAVQLAAALPQEKQLAIKARFNEAKKDWNKASELYRSLWTFYPDNLEYGLGLANSLLNAGRIAEALATVSSLRQLPPPARDDPGIDLVAAQVARQRSEPAEELRLGKVAAEKGKQLGQTQVMAEALLLQGGALYIMGRADEAIRCFDQAEDLFAETGNQAARARTLNRIGAVLLDISDYSEADKRYEEALAIAKQLGSSELIAKQKMAMAFVAADLGDLERSRSLSEEVHARFIEQGDLLYEARSVYKRSEVQWEMGDTEKARQGYEELLMLARKGANQVEEMRALIGIGQSLASTGALKEARARQEMALGLANASLDQTLTASYRASVAQILIWQGDLPMARKRLDLALAGKRRVGDRLGASQVLGLLSALAQRQGDLALARRSLVEQRALAEEIHAALAIARALERQGQLEAAAGDLVGARKQLSEALRISESRKAALLATDIRLDLARIAWLEGKSAEAESLAREAGSWYRARGLTDREASALALLSRVLLERGRAEEARDAAGQARAIAEKSENVELKIEVAIGVMPAVAAAIGQKTPLGPLRWAAGEAARLGFVAAGFEARFTLGILQLAQGDTAAGRKLLTEVRRDAEARGFKDVARRAAAALQGSSVPLG